jgi:hypothetical protein
VIRSDKSKHRETSNKALTAVNNLALAPFLMSFLSSRDRLPLPTVTSAGASRSFNSFNVFPLPQRADAFLALLPSWGLLYSTMPLRPDGREYASCRRGSS